MGLLGLGTVGVGVATVLQGKYKSLDRRLGRSIEITRVLVRDLNKDRAVSVPSALLTTRASDVIDSPDIDLVVEVLGGVDPAFDYVRRSLGNGKHVITANKELMAHHGLELLRIAQEHDRDLFFEASVGGGIPLIGPFRQDLAANEISEIHAIINGTTNYVLTRMADDGVDFDQALEEAKQKGYAEPDPTNDIDGNDSAYKLSILASLAYGGPVPPASVYKEGIRQLSNVDFDYAGELGYTIKLLAISKKDAEGIEVRVHPALVTRDYLLSQVSGVENAVRIKGDLLGHAVFAGRGAGPGPTSSAIVADLIDLVHNMNSGTHARIPARFEEDLVIKPMSQVFSRYYFRIWVVDRAGVLAKIGKVCAETGISIAAIVQKESDPATGTAEMVILTHAAMEADMQKAMAAIANLDVVESVATFLRVEDLTEED